MKTKKHNKTFLKVIVGFSFGKQKDSPGNTNKGLAWLISKIIDKYKKSNHSKPKLILQEEIANALYSDYNIKADYIIRARQVKSKYLDTSMVANIISRYMLPKNNECLVVAHPDHIKRCINELKKHNINGKHYKLMHNYIPWKKFNCSKYGYSKKSIQLWTTTRKRFLKHEKNIKNN